MKKNDNKIILFNDKQVRRYFDDEKEIWYFSVVDVVSILSDSTIPKKYWADLKSKLKNEGSEVYDKIVQLKFKARDGKYYATDCFSTENLLRLIQSIPSPKAEPFKLWLAKVGNDRINESQDPELAIDRAMIYYQTLVIARNGLTPVYSLSNFAKS
jgi:prophage antirepressor-like protein